MIKKKKKKRKYFVVWRQKQRERLSRRRGTENTLEKLSEAKKEMAKVPKLRKSQGGEENKEDEKTRTETR